MSTSGANHETLDAGEADSQPAQYPTYAQLRSSGADLTSATSRLVWSFSGSLETSISVMPFAYNYNVDVLEPYFQHTGTARENSPWHVISKLALTVPPVSEIVVTVYDLECWEDDWEDFHENHSDPYCHSESEDLHYGEPSDADPDSDEDEPQPYLLRCCGTDRPSNKKGGVLVTASQSGPGFVTVHDYITTVHPWLMRNREDILGAMNRCEDLHEPEKMDLVVDAVSLLPNRLVVKEKSEWIRELSLRRQRIASVPDLEVHAV